MADVPLGAFVSGGLDSSLIAALMQSECRQPIKLFTIGLGTWPDSEHSHAARVAEYLGAEFYPLIIQPNDFFERSAPLMSHSAIRRRFRLYSSRR